MLGMRTTPLVNFALMLDAALVRMARGRGAVDLALGETLVALFTGDRLVELGYARQVDYARERLGVAPRTMYAWTQLATVLAGRPVLRQGVVAGKVSPRKALTVMPVAVGDREEAWTAAAMSLTLSELERRVREAGAEPPDTFAVDTLMLRMTPGQQDRLDAAIGVAREVIGLGAPRWQCVEAICMEWLGAFGKFGDEGVAGLGPEVAGAIGRQLSVVEEAGAREELPRDASALDARALRLVRARRGFDEPLGRMLVELVTSKLWRFLGYRTLEEYCRERLGLSPRSVRQRVWMERRMRALPEIRAALASGRLGWSRALIVARDARPSDVVERIEEAVATTWQQLDRDSTALEDRQNRARGVRRLWGPEEALETLALAIGSAQALAESRGDRIGAGEALAVMADHFISVWKEVTRRQKVPKARREVLLRHGGYCAVPGCSRAAEHDHHVAFRSRGGSDALANRTGLCPIHHLRGVHRGRLRITGRAGERLTFRFGDSEVWVLQGEDDARRMG